VKDVLVKQIIRGVVYQFLCFPICSRGTELSYGADYILRGMVGISTAAADIVSPNKLLKNSELVLFNVLVDRALRGMAREACRSGSRAGKGEFIL
jgi:hypothetical protein